MGAGAGARRSSAVHHVGSQADVVISGDSAGDLFGLSLAVGDISADGIDDLIIAAPGAGEDKQGRIWVFAMPG